MKKFFEILSRTNMFLIKLSILLGVFLLTDAVDVNNLLRSLSVEEKCGQMTQVLLGVVEKEQSDPTYLENPVDLKKLRDALQKYKLGSILGMAYGTPTLKQWHSVIRLIHDVALNETTHRVPVIYGTDSIHGAFITNAVLFPQQISMAASFNTELVANISRVIALETRAAGTPWNFSPILDIGRHPLWPRLYETFGEDVHLASKMAEVYVKAHQGTDLKNRRNAAACLKHYVGYSYPFNGRDRTPAYIPEVVLREFFLPSFESGVRAGALSLMINSGEVNGMPGHANYHYLTTILKGEWNFTGFTVSDFEDIKRLHTRDKIAETPEEAVYIAVMAGVDMSMVPDDFSFWGHCVSLANKRPEFLNRVNDAVYRILHVKNEIGLFDDPYPHESDGDAVGTVESENLALTGSQESIILAKNERNILPLSKTGLNILLTGPTSNRVSVLSSGWSYSWQGDNEADYVKFGPKRYSIVEAFKNRTVSSQVTHVEGVDFQNVTDLDAVVAAASKSDVVILCIGEKAYAETPGNIDDLMISDSQLTLARVLFETGKRVVVVYVGGRPRTMTEIVEKAAAVVVAFIPGPRGGEAIADVIFGTVNPSAKFPITYPRGPNGYMTYDYRPLERDEYQDYTPLFQFGFGLSYTEFAYSKIILNSTNVKPPNGIAGSVIVKNTGNRAGQEVVIVYLNDEFNSYVSRPVRQMKAFKKIYLEANEEKTVSFEISLKDMSFIDSTLKRVYEAGKFNIYVSTLETSFNLECPTRLCNL